MSRRRAPPDASAPPARAFERACLGAILAAAAALRLWYLAELARTPFYDHLVLDLAAYDSWAQRIARGEWLGSTVFYQDPLYPYFLGALYALFGRKLLVVYLVQIALGTLTCYLVYAISRRLFSPPAGLIAAALAALYKPFIFYDVQIEKSFLAVLLISAACLALVAALDRRKPAPWVLAGFLLGAAVLVRGNYLALLPLVAAGLALLPPDRPRRERLVAAACYAAGAALVLSAIAARNYAVGRDLVLATSQAGQNFYIGNNAGNTTGMYRAPDFVRSDPKFEEVDFAREAERRLGRRLAPSEVSRFWLGEAWSFIARHPLEFLRVSARRAALLANDYEIPDNLDLYFFRRYSTLLALPLPGFALVAGLALWGMLASARDASRLWPLHVLTWGYLTTIALFYVFSRYRLPVVPFLLVFAGEGARRLAEAARRPSWRGLVPAGLVLAAAFAARHPLVDPFNPPALVNLGAVLMKLGELEPAEALFRQVLARRPDFADARNNLGVLLLRRDDVAAALEELRAAVALGPRRANAYVNLALALSRQGNPEEARAALGRARELAPESAEVYAAEASASAGEGDLEGAARAYRAALGIEPGSPELHNNLGVALLRQQKLQEALEEFRQAGRAGGGADSLFNEGVCLERLGHAGEAREAYRRAIAARPDYAQAYNNLGNLLAESGDRLGAIAAYEGFLRSWRGDTAARRAVEEEVQKLR